jgi:2-amino-4-hydroxy-6-hydroxymethyldihydropteridine diphosphokinase
MAQVFIGLGSNLGDRSNYLKRALAELALLPETVSKTFSSVYETEPVGKKDQPQFLNMVVELDSTLLPTHILTRLKEIECMIGRSHNEHWGPREIDLDLLYVGSEVINEDALQLPHPEIAHRRFVLAPMKEIAETFLDPLQRLNINELLRLCSDTSTVRKIISSQEMQGKG